MTLMYCRYGIITRRVTKCLIFLWLYLITRTTPLPLPKWNSRYDPPVHPLHAQYKDEIDDAEDIFTQILKYNKGSTMKLYHGDIAMNRGLSATQCTDCLWTKSADEAVNVPYRLSSDYTDDEKSLIKRALQDFTTLTCVHFVERSTEANYLDIGSGSGCWSYIGKVGGGQFVSVMKNGCVSRGIIQHEIQHALGFYHEQSRSDRDAHVDVMWQYIAADDWGNFEKIDTDNLGLVYDYASVMHYGRYSFSNTTGQPSLVPKPEPSVDIGQRYGLSQLDVYKINKMYNCKLCSFLLTGTSGSLDSKNYTSEYSSASSCLWLIRVNNNKAVLQFDALDVQPSAGCSSDYITVYDGASTMSPVLLDRACGNQALPLLVASGNVMLVEMVSDRAFTATTDFKATYSSANCGGTYNYDNGTIFSPGYPNLYPNLVDCISTIWAPAGHQIVLNFTAFELEFSSSCLYDYLIIKDGSRSSSQLLGKFCWDMSIPGLISTGNVLLVQFHSDSWVNKPGYKATYYFVKSS
ncbi:hypothetical protein FKM82_003292 [Ascaphus truei]